MAKNADDIQELEAELRTITDGVLKPLIGKALEDIPPQLIKRIGNLITRVHFLHSFVFLIEMEIT